VLRLWYTRAGSRVVGTRVKRTDNPPSNVYESQICHAESEDAVHWERPGARVVEYEGHPDNNIEIPSLRPPGSAWVMHVIDDPFEEGPLRLFKIMYLDQAAEGEIGGGSALGLEPHEAYDELPEPVPQVLIAGDAQRASPALRRTGRLRGSQIRITASAAPLTRDATNCNNAGAECSTEP